MPPKRLLSQSVDGDSDSSSEASEESKDVPIAPPAKKFVRLEQSESNYNARWGDKYSDMTIVCQAKVFHVHKFVVCRQVPAIEKMMSGHFKEARENKVTTDATDPDTLSLFLDVVYGGLQQALLKIAPYTAGTGISILETRLNAVHKLVDLYALGNYWQADGVMDWVISEITRITNTTEWKPEQIAQLLKSIPEKMPEGQEMPILKALQKLLYRTRHKLVANEKFMEAFPKMRPGINKAVLKLIIDGENPGAGALMHDRPYFGLFESWQ